MITVKELKHFLDTECKDKDDAVIYGSYNGEDFFAAKKIATTKISNEDLIYFNF